MDLQELVVCMIMLLCGVVLVIYSIYWRRYQCEKRLMQAIEKKHGEYIKIEKIDEKEEIYHVSFVSYGRYQEYTVRFDLNYEMTWS
ncbi:MAG: hypothetical protein PUC65_13440 [Clostridiales bacterium]|nr:hypothetical protein [Clostridiales bacterium]